MTTQTRKARVMTRFAFPVAVALVAALSTGCGGKGSAAR